MRPFRERNVFLRQRLPALIRGEAYAHRFRHLGLVVSEEAPGATESVAGEGHDIILRAG